MTFMKDKVIDVDAKDQQLWALITDVPRLKAPMQYICFILNVLIPGKFKFEFEQGIPLTKPYFKNFNLTVYRYWHDDSLLLL